jgi:hypothetical protein
MGLHFMIVLAEAEDDISWRRVEGFEMFRGPAVLECVGFMISKKS